MTNHVDDVNMHVASSVLQPAVSMMSLLVPRKTVGFEPPNIAPAAYDSDSDSDGADDSGAMLKKAMTVS